VNLSAVRTFELLLMFLFGIRKNVGCLPDEQCVIVSNHNSDLDTYALASLLSRTHKKKTRVVAARDTFAGGFAGWFARWSLDALLVDRHPTGHHDPLAEVKEALKKGRSLIVYPEGTRGEPGKLESFKRGVGVLAAEFPDLPVYPVFIKGVEKCLARNEYLIVPFEIGLTATDKPLYGRDFLKQTGGGSREASKLITQALEEEVKRLGGLKRVATGT
jgi:1-acyl-sn-glycerol-3-phosphate acyltransferase